MSDIWDEDGGEMDIIRCTSKKFEDQIRTSAFKEGVDSVDSEKHLQGGFNDGFQSATELYRPLGQLKVDESSNESFL